MSPRLLRLEQLVLPVRLCKPQPVTTCELLVVGDWQKYTRPMYEVSGKLLSVGENGTLGPAI
ncbi:hypothetical protein BM221_006352 [Beauveria bassiana]|uniref:Uncharacterized protein n=1 Tax=Beauveria bassiana TaxID=176275 RepID=A0A2N6NLM4_BEABA|nr:hypothetical protein BM221_006352 [Beauveria bassiana]